MFSRKHVYCFSLCVCALLMVCIGVPEAISQDAAKTWQDSDTGLIWTVKDNGEDVSFNEARSYCSRLDLDGFTDWRLPTLDELKAIYDKSQSKTYKAKGPIELEMPTIWSSSQNPVGDVWSLNFSYGGRSLSPTGGCGSAGRTLCVQEASK